MGKEPRLSMSIQYTYKDPPKGYVGLCGEHVTYARDKLVPFHFMVRQVIEDMMCYYIRFQDAATLNESLAACRDWLAKIEIVETQESTDG